MQRNAGQAMANAQYRQSQSVANAKIRQSERSTCPESPEPGHGVNQSQIVANVQNRLSGHGKWPGSSESAVANAQNRQSSLHAYTQFGC